MGILVLAFVSSTFVLAGFVKGVIGLGLPTVGMGLLAVVMTPAHAAACTCPTRQPSAEVRTTGYDLQSMIVFRRTPLTIPH
jgi:hypothetical protein